MATAADDDQDGEWYPLPLRLVAARADPSSDVDHWAPISRP